MMEIKSNQKNDTSYHIKFDNGKFGKYKGEQLSFSKSFTQRTNTRDKKKRDKKKRNQLRDQKSQK